VPVFSANLTMLWPEISDPYERFRAAANAGFSRVERLFVHDLDPLRIKELLEELTLELVLFDPYAGDWEAGERGLLALPGRESELRDTVFAAIDTARMLGVPRLNVLSGMLPDGVDRQQAQETAVSNLKELATTARSEGITLMVEPINDHDWPGYAIPAIADALAVVRTVDHPNVGLQFDTYHIATKGDDIFACLGESIESIRHVQIADAPGRHQPGTGTLPLGRFLIRLDDLGYNGAVGLEYTPDGNTDAALAWLDREARR
jgi:hydroxypyruvate isomerase